MDINETDICADGCDANQITVISEHDAQCMDCGRVGPY